MQVMHCTADLFVIVNRPNKNIKRQGRGYITIYIYIYICMVQANFPDCIRLSMEDRNSSKLSKKG